MKPKGRAEADQVARKQASGSVLKALDVIDVLAAANRPLALSELAAELQRPAPSVHRLLRSLELRDYVETLDGRYRLTLKLFEIGSGVVESIDVVAEARPICAALSKELEATVNMAIRSGLFAVYVMKVESPRSLRMTSRLGMHAPLHGTGMGKVLLAYATPEEREELLDAIEYEPYTKNTITSRDLLEKDLARVVRNGYGLDNGEFDAGVVCLAAPVFGRSGEVIAAMSASNLAPSLPRSEWRRVGLRVRRAADDVSQRLGYTARPCAVS